jgi:hypothetical protein
MAAAQGVFSKLGIDTVTTASMTARFDFIRESVKRRGSLLNGNGLRGTREEYIDRVRDNIYRVGGSISLQPNAVELALLMPWILGAAGSGTTYALADTLTSRYIAVDRIAKVFTYTGCYVNRATFRASQGEPLTLDLDIVGQTETVGNAGTFPSINIDTTGLGPFIFTDLALTIAGITYNAKDLEITVDNQLDTERFFNSQTLVSVVPTGRSIAFRTTLPYGDATAVYNAGASGVAVNATFTNNTVSCLFAMGSVAFPTDAPTVPGRSEVMLAVEGQAYHTGSTNSLIVTLDSTP